MMFILFISVTVFLVKILLQSLRIEQFSITNWTQMVLSLENFLIQLIENIFHQKEEEFFTFAVLKISIVSEIFCT